MSRPYELSDWSQSPEGQAVFSELTDPQTGFPRVYGVLEKPNLGPLEQVNFKIFLWSRSSDKSNFLGFLTGRERLVPSPGSDIPGIRVTDIYWAAQTGDKRVRLFKLSFWDSGDSASKKYAHVESSLREGASATLLLFSGDSGLREADIQIGRIKASEGNRLGIVLAACGSDVDPSDLENKWGIPVHRIIQQSSSEVAYLLHSICGSVVRVLTPVSPQV